MKESFPIKMMPGEEPYQESELQRLFSLIGQAASFDEIFGEKGEIEDYAIQMPFQNL